MTTTKWSAEPWLTKLEAIIRKVGSLRNLARLMEEDDPGKLSRWRNYGLLPSPADQVTLAAVSGEDVEEIRHLVWLAEGARDSAREERRIRPSMGAAASPVVPSAKSPPVGATRSRRPKRLGRKLAALAFWLGVGAAPAHAHQEWSTFSIGYVLSDMIRRRGWAYAG